jgi:hypothetical protein
MMKRLARCPSARGTIAAVTLRSTSVVPSGIWVVADWPWANVQAHSKGMNKIFKVTFK